MSKDKDSRPKRAEAPPLYWPMHDVVTRPLKMLHRVKVINGENLPAADEGGCIIAGMHNGALDGAFISLGAGTRGRAIRWVGDEGICNAPVIGPVIRKIGVIPIASHKGVGTDPEQIKKALKEASSVLTDGGTVGIFPEGTIHPFTRGRKLFPFKTGIIRLAIETGVPIIPAWGQGVGAIFPWLRPVTIKEAQVYLMLPLWTPSPVRVHFGKPFIVEKSLDLTASYEDLKRECNRLEMAFEDFVFDRRDIIEDWSM